MQNWWNVASKNRTKPTADFWVITGELQEAYRAFTLPTTHADSDKNKLTETELFRIKPMREVIKTTNPHGHKDYLEIIYLQAGAGTHQIVNGKTGGIRL